MPIFFFYGAYCPFLALSLRNLPSYGAHLFLHVGKSGFYAWRLGAAVLAWRLIALTKALLAEDLIRRRDKLCFDRRNLHRRFEHFGGEPMKVVVAANTLRLIGDSKTFVFNLQCVASHRTDETRAAI
jgi:hypothetical protein